MFTVYESEEVLIECNEIRNNKNDGQPYLVIGDHLYRGT
jgi:hypothetical protein